MVNPGSISDSQKPKKIMDVRRNLFTAFSRLIIPAPYHGESGLSLQRREALQMVLLTVLIVTLILSVVTWSVGYHDTFYTTLILTGVAGLCLVLNSYGYRTWAAALLSFGLLIFIEINSFFGEGIHDIVILALPGVIVIAGLLYGRQSVPFFTFLSILTLVISPILPYRNQIYGLHLDDSIIGSVLLIGLGALVEFAMRRMEEHIERVQHSETAITAAYEATLEGWAKALELRDRETEGHSRKVTEMTVRLAKALGLTDQKQLTNIRYGALLHDIGKIGIPDSILLKRGTLNTEEWKVMKQHPIIAGTLVENIPYLKQAREIVLYHHERWDGTGYPTGLRGEQIPLAARIFAVVDNWQALSADRPYRPAWPRDEVLTFLKQSAGTMFDPSIVRTFLDMVEGPDANIQ